MARCVAWPSRFAVGSTVHCPKATADTTTNRGEAQVGASPGTRGSSPNKRVRLSGTRQGDRKCRMSVCAPCDGLGSCDVTGRYFSRTPVPRSRPALVPLDDPNRPPHVRPAIPPVRCGDRVAHWPAPADVVVDRLHRDAEVLGDLGGRPPLVTHVRHQSNVTSRHSIGRSSDPASTG